MTKVDSRRDIGQWGGTFTFDQLLDSKDNRLLVSDTNKNEYVLYKANIHPPAKRGHEVLV